MKLTIIDPIDDPRLLEYIRLKHAYKSCAVYRFYSLIMYGTPVESLAPTRDILQYLLVEEDGDECTKKFDMLYAQQLINNPASFIDLMQIMNALQYYNEVFLISNYKHPNVSPILDSLIKFIQERYAISPLIVNAMEDIDELAKCDFQNEMGYQNLMNDMDRFRMTCYTPDQIRNEVID